jgi:hypothetical protein
VVEELVHVGIGVKESEDIGVKESEGIGVKESEGRDKPSPYNNRTFIRL